LITDSELEKINRERKAKGLPPLTRAQAVRAIADNRTTSRDESFDWLIFHNHSVFDHHSVGTGYIPPASDDDSGKGGSFGGGGASGSWEDSSPSTSSQSDSYSSGASSSSSDSYSSSYDSGSSSFSSSDSGSSF
jgi:hypothetical protein